MAGIWGEYEDVFLYLTEKQYADDKSKGDKRRIREKASIFAVQDGILCHKGGKGAITKVIIDVAEKDRLVLALHASSVGGSHYGQNATLKKLSERFWWKGMSDDVKTFVRNCDVCQMANPSNRAPASTLHPIPVSGLFHRWGIDMVGPLTTTKNGNRYLIVATEYLTKWVEATAVPDKTSDGIHKFLMNLVYRFGACHVLLHDQGREFNNGLVNDLCERLKISVAMSSAYHPQTNGYVLLIFLN